MTVSTWRPRTQAVRGALTRTGFCETSEALFLNSGYVYETGQEVLESFDGTRDRFVYSRFRNPTVAMFEERLALIEGAAACRATASGMAAVHAALLGMLKAGDRVVAARALFGSCFWIVNDLLPRYGIEVEFVCGSDLDDWKRALSRPVKAVFVETPANPTLELVDIAAVARLTHAAGGLLLVDNAFASPILQKPIPLGADIVIYSTTKYIDGQGRCMGGAILTADSALIDDEIGLFLRHTGPCLSPFNAWVMLKGLETLDIRMEHHNANAETIARFLENHPGIENVLYPGLDSHPQHDLALRQMKGGGGIVAFTLTGGRNEAFGFMDRLTLIDISNNLGDTKSLITHPFTSTHQKLAETDKAAMGITENLIRLSVGLEDVDDVIDDLKQALEP